MGFNLTDILWVKNKEMSQSGVINYKSESDKVLPKNNDFHNLILNYVQIVLLTIILIYKIITSVAHTVKVRDRRRREYSMVNLDRK